MSRGTKQTSKGILRALHGLAMTWRCIGVPQAVLGPKQKLVLPYRHNPMYFACLEVIIKNGIVGVRTRESPKLTSEFVLRAP
jgi:hypothetical protein